MSNIFKQMHYLSSFWNGQAEKTLYTVWKTIQLALKTVALHPEQWEIVLLEALHSIRSLLCTATNTAPHERFFSFREDQASDHHSRVALGNHFLTLFRGAVLFALH